MKKFVYDQGVESKSAEGDNITMSIFFDGTQNNKTNNKTGKSKKE